MFKTKDKGGELLDNNGSIKTYLLSFFLVLFIIITIILSFIVYRLYNKNLQSFQQLNVANLPSSQENISLYNTTSNSHSYNVSNSINNSFLNSTSSQSDNTNFDAEQIANDTYKKAYNLFHNDTNIITEGIYDINGEKKSGYKINISKLETIFSEKLIYELKSQLIEINGEYYDFSTSPNFYEKLDLYSIFGSTDQGFRNLTVKTYTDNLIIAQGQLSSDMEDDIIYGHLDKYPLYIIFTKENDNWLIDLYE